VATKCPKCGFYQDKGPECGRCGIIFDRYRPIEAELHSSHYPDLSVEVFNAPSTSIFRRAFRVFRWSSLGMLGITLALILVPSPPPEVEASTKSAERADTKVRKFAALLEKGQALPLEMNESELNSWLTTNLVLQHSTPSTAQSLQTKAPQSAAQETAVAASQDSESAMEEVQSSVTDVKIELLEDSLRAYVAFDFHGKELTLVLEGRVSTLDGYLRLELNSGQLGSLPLPAVALENAARKLFEGPKNRDKFRLPSQIQGIYVLNGNLLLIPQKPNLTSRPNDG
jgi:hypothetical protein